MSSAAARNAVVPLILLPAILIASISPIRSYDYFWHLATGRWMVEHRNLPATDPFAVASDPAAWINGEWLFQLGLYGAYKVGGHAGISYLRGLAVAALFMAVFLLARRRTHWAPALLLTLIAWVGADHRLTARAETVATFLLVAAVGLVIGPMSWRRIFAYGVVTAVWINVHPSALLSPIFVMLGALDGRELRKRAAMLVASLLALLVNPYGLQGVLAPVRLMRTISDQAFVNLEWLPSDPRQFPLLYLFILGGFALFLISRERRHHFASLALLAFLGFLAVRHLRNQGFFFAAAPPLIAPLIRRQWRGVTVQALALAAALMWGVVLFGRLPLGTGIDERLFPVRAVERLQQIGIAGNIYNPDQFGGFLIWTFYPQRRVLTDGRNELYPTYLREYQQARADSRAWNRLLEKYQVRIAVEEYRSEPLEVIDVTDGSRERVPASLVFFPRERWALVAYDPVAMVFVRRDAVGASRLRGFELDRIEKMEDPRRNSQPENLLFRN